MAADGKQLTAVTDLAALANIGKNVCIACHEKFPRPKK